MLPGFQGSATKPDAGHTLPSTWKSTLPIHQMWLSACPKALSANTSKSCHPAAKHEHTLKRKKIKCCTWEHRNQEKAV